MLSMVIASLRRTILNFKTVGNHSTIVSKKPWQYTDNKRKAIITNTLKVLKENKKLSGHGTVILSKSHSVVISHLIWIFMNFIHCNCHLSHCVAVLLSYANTTPALLTPMDKSSCLTSWKLCIQSQSNWIATNVNCHL